MQSRSSLNAALSDRMSRSKMALLLPSPPTALQVMKADIENGIIESKNLHIFVACVKQAAGRFSWLLPCDIFNLCCCQALVLVDGFTMVLVVATPLHLTGLPIQKPLCQPVPSRVQWETRRWHSMRGLQWMVYIISRYDR